jgi:hypothetical protein
MIKKAILIVLAVLLLLILFVYVFIPRKIEIVESIPVQSTLNGTARLVFHTEKWKSWWPGEFKGNDSIYYFNENKFKPENGFASTTAIDVDISGKNFQINSALLILPASEDSIFIQWLCRGIKVSNNPFKRIQQWKQARDIRHSLRSLLQTLKSFLDNEKNIYGMSVNKVKVTDSILITTKFTTYLYPTTTDIYAAVDKIKKYIAEQHATENNSPMFHIEITENGNYQVQVAVPVNKELPNVNGMVMKRMALGNILEAELHGGQATVQKGMTELENYKQDHSLISPAIPFQLLVTDRRKETDTSKWITRIYYPIF